MADLIGGAVISEVLRQLIEEVKKFKNFKPLSKDLASTMKRLVPLTETIDSLTNKLNLDDGELKGLKETIERAKIVIDKCRDVSRLKRSKRTREIEQVNKDMQNYCQIDIQLLLYRNQLQSTEAINNNFQNINQKLDQLSAPAPVFRQSMEAINNNLQIIFEKLDRFVVSAPGGCGETTLVTQLCHDQDIKAEKCGRQAGGPTPPPPDPTGGLTDIITRSQFDDMLKHRNEAACPARGFYTYDAFIAAAKYFPSFCNNGDTAARKKELAAFFGQTSHETTGGWPTAPDGPYSWGYCFKEEVNPSSDYCSPSPTWPCAPGKRYYGRGPMQLSWNYNYGKCGAAIGEDLLNNPDLVSSDPVISFKTAIWFWMTPQSPEPSCHAVINGQWQPSDADIAAGRLPGYGVITNIINGGLECGHGPDPRVLDRIGFYERYCGIFGVDPGSNLDCYNQRSFASVNSLLDAAM